eukprot:3602503-Prymnesium_polylepis.1
MTLHVNAPWSFFAPLMRANICSHLNFKHGFEPLTVLEREAVALASNLRVLAFVGYTRGPLDTLREACAQNRSLCVVTAYAAERPIWLPNNLIPHPHCWSTTSFYSLASLPQLQCVPHVVMENVVHDISALTFPLSWKLVDDAYGGTSHVPLQSQFCLTVGENEERVGGSLKESCFHGTTVHNVASICADGYLHCNEGYLFTTPNPAYALHPSFATPYFFTRYCAIQILVEVIATKPIRTQPATVPCNLSQNESIEFIHDSAQKVHNIYGVVYFRKPNN